MNSNLVILCVIFAAIVAFIVACNFLVNQVSKGKCYDRIDSIPHSTMEYSLVQDARAPQALIMMHGFKVL